MTLNLYTMIGPHGEILHPGNDPTHAQFQAMLSATGGGVWICDAEFWRDLPTFANGVTKLLWDAQHKPNEFVEKVGKMHPHRRIWLIGGRTAFKEFAPLVNGITLFHQVRRVSKANSVRFYGDFPWTQYELDLTPARRPLVDKTVVSHVEFIHGLHEPANEFEQFASTIKRAFTDNDPDALADLMQHTKHAHVYRNWSK